MYKKNKPIDIKQTEPQVNERIKQLQAEASAVNLEYKLSDVDIAELVFDKYVEKFPDSYALDLTKLVRIKVGSDPQNYLMYSTEEYVTDNVKFKKHKFTRRRIGFHPIVTGEPVYNEYGTLENYDIGTPQTSFDIKFDPEEIKRLIASARSGPKELLIARGAIAGEFPLVDPPYSCFNLDDFLYGDFDLLIQANKLGYLNSSTGYQEYLAVRGVKLSHGVDTKENGSKQEK